MSLFRLYGLYGLYGCTDSDVAGDFLESLAFLHDEFALHHFTINPYNRTTRTTDFERNGSAIYYIL